MPSTSSGRMTRKKIQRPTIRPTSAVAATMWQRVNNWRQTQQTSPHAHRAVLVMLIMILIHFRSISSMLDNLAQRLTARDHTCRTKHIAHLFRKFYVDSSEHFLVVSLTMACHPRATCHIAGCCHLANSMSWFQSYVSHCRVLPLGEFNGMSSQSHVSRCRVLPLGEFTVMNPEPHATMQGAVTWRNQCHDHATLQGVRIPIAILKFIFINKHCLQRNNFECTKLKKQRNMSELTSAGSSIDAARCRRATMVTASAAFATTVRRRVACFTVTLTHTVTDLQKYNMQWF